jgi:uncharacterized damage-inducible protein DinB
MADQPDVWLRGAIEGVPALLQPVAHSLKQALEDVEKACKDLTFQRLWARPGGVAPIGYHLRHMAGSIDRLCTYARDERLTPDQISLLKLEGKEGADELDDLMQRLRVNVTNALDQLRHTSEASLTQPREVGRSKLPSSVIGLLNHAAEHAYRHAGQIATTAKLV